MDACPTPGFGGVPAVVSQVPATNPGTESRDYEARHLLVLEGLEAVRKRPAMYIGSTDTRGLMHCLWEIIDNAVDEALGGFGREILITLRPDGGISVPDHGRGIPVDIEPRTGLSGVEVVFTKLHAGGKFGAGSYNATGGLHGVGASVVNALSARLDVEVDRGGGHLGDVVPARCARCVRRRRADRRRSPRAAACARSAGPRRASPAPGSATGPTGRSSSRTRSSRLKDLEDRARQTSFLVPGLALQVVDARTDELNERDLQARRRDRGVLRVPGARPAPSPTWSGCSGQDRFTETVPMLDDAGHMTPTDVDRDLDIDIAVRWGDRLRDRASGRS